MHFQATSTVKIFVTNATFEDFDTRQQFGHIWMYPFIMFIDMTHFLKGKVTVVTLGFSHCTFSSFGHVRFSVIFQIFLLVASESMLFD
eukprot:02382.XXX_27438_27701_1 [CDS] Oithona nana genome sequencing.